MRFVHVFAAMLGCVTASAAPAGQPISHSMAQCAALYGTASDWAKGESNAARLQQAAGAFVLAAQAQAEVEGWMNPTAHIDEVWVYNRAKWRTKGKTYVYSQDFRDWTGYCKALARDRSIALK